MAKKSTAAVVDTIEEAVADVKVEAAEAATTASEQVKAKFSKAIEDARAGAAALGKDWQDKAAPYREKLTSVDLAAEAKAIGEQAKERALALAADGKVKTSDALSSFGKVVAENASLVDDKLGAKYGDYARTAARSIQETAAKLESKDLEALGKEASDYVKKNPIVAAGVLLAVGFGLAKLFGGGSDEEA